MEVAVLISGVADPKWPLPRDPSLGALLAHAAQCATLSPFDEAALELALSLRAADPSVRLTCLVAGDESLARRVAGWRPDALHRIEMADVPCWDAGLVAQALAHALAELAGTARLVLAGREFGDFDDGSVPTAVAALAGLPLLPLVLGIGREGAGLVARRQAAGGLEHVWPAGRLLATVTNDPGNRLRHPLMKNVLLARKLPIPSWRAAAPQDAGRLRLEGVQAATAPQSGGTCTWLQGSDDQKAEALARVLAEAAGA
jgi:electron transfer flavoprotein beta subunit